MPAVSLLSDADEVVGKLTGIRRQIMDSLDEPNSATGLAQLIGTTRQRINYHLRALEDMGLVELASIRQRRGLAERIMQRTTAAVIVSPTVFADLDLDERETASVTGVVSVAADVIRQVAEVSNEASSTGSRLATATFDTRVSVKSPSDLRRLIEDISNVIASYNEPGGVEFRLAGFALPEKEGGKQ